MATSASHPPPATRLINVSLTALSTYGDIAQFEQCGEESTGPGYLTEILRPAANDLMATLVELELVAQFFDLKRPIYRSGYLSVRDTSIRKEEAASPLARDIFQLMFKGPASHKELITDAGRVFVDNLDGSVDLPEQLAGEEILGELAAGGGEDISGGMGDERYNPETGTHDKVRGSHTHPDGTVTEVHGDRNRETGELSDTKFKDPPDNNKSRGN